MSKRNRREHGRILSVETMQRGSALDVDAAVGATSITVTDGGDFDEDGGWLYIGDQVVEFTACDDDTGVITLATALTAAAEQGDPVAVYDPLYGEVVDYQVALVQLDGEYDNPDPVEAEVAEGVPDLPEGDRGKAGESCTLLRVADDEWEVVGVGGRPRKSRGQRFEDQDTFTLATSGSQAFQLSLKPIVGSVHMAWLNQWQPHTEFTVDYSTGVVDVPDPNAWLEPGDVIDFRYAYLSGITTPPVQPDAGFTFVGGVGDDSQSITLHPDTAAGNLAVLFIPLGPGRQSVTDAKGWTLAGTSAAITYDSGFPFDTVSYALHVYWRVIPAGAYETPALETTANPTWINWEAITVDGPSTVSAVAFDAVDAAAATAIGPALVGGGMTHAHAFRAADFLPTIDVPDSAALLYGDSSYRPGATATATDGEFTMRDVSTGDPLAADWLLATVAFG